MKRTKITTAILLAAPTLLIVAFAFASAGARPPGSRGWNDRACAPVSGTVMTNFGALAPDSPNTTLGTATGDLRGAVAGSLQGNPQVSGNTAIFKVLHHWVTDSGDSIYFDVATATTLAISSTRFAIVNYPVHITGGTGKFAGATGDLNNIGEVDLNGGTVFRYTGKVCYADPDNQ